MAIRLSVNINKVALLRNSRGAHNPAPLRAAMAAIDAGAHGITLHWREDNRHSLASDVIELCELTRARGVELNLEGDPRPELVDLALGIKPNQLTLVPVTPGEVTSDHGWDLPRQNKLLAPVLDRAKAAKIRTSIFMDVTGNMRAALATGTDRVELYTEPYAKAFGTAEQTAALQNVQRAAQAAHALGLGVNAGHDLDLENTPLLAREIPEICEVSIGHALIADALYLGLEETVKRYLQACRGEAPESPLTC